MFSLPSSRISALPFPVPSPLLWSAVRWAESLPSGPMACLAASARLSWRHEVLLCEEENTALQREDFSLYFLPSPLPTPNFMKCKAGLWGLTKEETDSCFLYGEQTRSCSKARIFSNENFFFSGNEGSHPGMIKSQDYITLTKTLKFIACTYTSMQNLMWPE